MADITKLITVLQPHLHWHRARLTCFAALILAVIKLRTVNLAQLALLVNPRRSIETNYRRLQRFLALFDPGADTLMRLLLALRPDPEEPLTLVLDRTEWKFASTRRNLLTLGYLWQGFVIPLRWMDLGREGNSNFYERRALLEPLLHEIGPTKIRALVADREFIGEAFFAWMNERALRFIIRIRKNARVRHQRSHPRARAVASYGLRAGELFADLAEGERRPLDEPQLIYSNRLYVVGARQGEEPWILVTNEPVACAEEADEVLALYGQRWSIETSFGAFKRRGFDLESTHLRSPERLERLVGVLAVALLWAVKVGLWCHQQAPIRLKRHGRRSVSLFRYGLDYLRQCLLRDDRPALRPAFQLLSCT